MGRKRIYTPEEAKERQRGHSRKWAQANPEKARARGGIMAEPNHTLGNKRSPAYDRARALFRMDKSPRTIWNTLCREGYSVSENIFGVWMNDLQVAKLADRMKCADYGDFRSRAEKYYGDRLYREDCPKRGGIQYYVDGQRRDVVSMAKEMRG